MRLVFVDNSPPTSIWQTAVLPLIWVSGVSLVQTAGAGTLG